jgi:lactoylglutathione lyase
MVAGAKQLKIGLRVSDLERSVALYGHIGFHKIPNQGQPMLRYMTFGHTWLVLSSRHSHGHHNEQRERIARSGPLGTGFVLVVPTGDIAAARELWRREGLPVTLEPEDAGFAEIFYGLDPDGDEVMFEQFRQ